MWAGCVPTYKYWLHRFFKEFKMTFKSKWMTYYKCKIFRKRLYLMYCKESSHEFDYYCYEIFKLISCKYGGKSE